MSVVEALQATVAALLFMNLVLSYLLGRSYRAHRDSRQLYAAYRSLVRLCARREAGLVAKCGARRRERP